MHSRSTAALPIGRVGPGGVDLLGTAFLLPSPGLPATAAHVVVQDDSNLVAGFRRGSTDPLTTNQDTSDTAAKTVSPQHQGIRCVQFRRAALASSDDVEEFKSDRRADPGKRGAPGGLEAFNAVGDPLGECILSA